MEMSSASVNTTSKREEIATFAVIDLETNDLPQHQYNKCGITELCIYAFSAKCLNHTSRAAILEKHFSQLDSASFNESYEENVIHEIPELPRVLHKLTLMINPRRLICDFAEKTTKLSNDMLCDERHFDEHTANLVINFLNRLIQPVCLVAHNGLGFDFPIIRYVLDNLQMKLPSSILCVDSLEAFREMDQQIDEIITPLQTSITNESNATDVLDWQKINEITPKRPIQHIHNNNDGKHISSTARKRLFKVQSKRAPRGFYKLGTIYERIFLDAFPNAHHAESDVHMLTKLILHYGNDFQIYANKNATSFDNVKPLGSRV